MLNLWKRGSAYKTAQCLTHFHTPLPPLADADRERLDRIISKPSRSSCASATASTC